MKSFATLCLKCVNCFGINQGQSNRQTYISNQDESDIVDLNNLTELYIEPSANQIRRTSLEKQFLKGFPRKLNKSFQKKNHFIRKKTFSNNQSTVTTVSTISPEISQKHKFMKSHIEDSKEEIQLNEKVLNQSNQKELAIDVKSTFDIGKNELQHFKNVEEIQISKENITSVNTSYLSEQSSDNNPIRFSVIVNKDPVILNQMVPTIDSDQKSYNQNDFCMQTPEE